MSGRRLVGFALVFLLGIAIAAYLAVRGPAIRAELAEGAELVYSVQGSLADTAPVLERRLRAFGLHGTVASAGGDRVAIRVPALDPDTQLLRAMLEMRGQLDFKLVIAKEQLGSYEEVEARIREVVAKKKEGTFRPFVDEEHVYDPYDVATQKEDGHYVLLDARGVSGSLLKDAHRSLDAAGRPAVGFTFDKKGRDAFYDLTSKNVGRAIAIVLDGVVQTAPVIRSAIGERGIIEGGAQGYTNADVQKLVAVLSGGQLPATLHFEQENKCAAEPGHEVGQAACVDGVGLVVMGAILAVALSGKP